MNNTSTVQIIKHGGELPPTPNEMKLTFRQGIKSLDAARGVLQREHAERGYLLQRHERLYWFVPKVKP